MRKKIETITAQKLEAEMILWNGEAKRNNANAPSERRFRLRKRLKVEELPLVKKTT